MAKPSLFFISSLLSIPVLTGCKPAGPPPDFGPTVEARNALTITLPAECVMEGGQKNLDFAILKVSCGGVPKIGLYAGNGANIDSDGRHMITKPDVQDRQVIMASDDPKTIRGYLWKTEYSWPEQLHIWLIDGQENDAVAQKIAASIRPTTPQAPASASGNN